MDAPSQAANISQGNHREISSWLMTLRRGSEKKQQTEKPQQIILVVDNKPFRQFYTSIFLQRLKYHVIMAKTAEDALSFLSLSTPLVIIADVDLPQTSGIDLLKRVKQDRRSHDIPFIIYTSNKDPRMELSCKNAGAAAYLTHAAAPLDELYAAIQNATETKPRRFFRLTTCLDVIIGASLPPVSKVGSDSIIAISEKGMFVNTTAPLAYGSIHPFSFSLPNAPGWLFRIEGQVIYNHVSKDSKGLPGIGVKFLKIGSQEQELIRDFIRETLMEGISIV